MADAFISYSRRDMEFVRKLTDALISQNRETWVDWDNIPRSVDWWIEIQRGIEYAHTFIAIVSQSAIASEIWNRELEFARNLNKRIVPVVLYDVDEKRAAGDWYGKTWESTARSNWELLKSLNWVFRRENDPFDETVSIIIAAIDTDPAHIRVHTRLLVRAREWEIGGRKPDLLLLGDEITASENWLQFANERTPRPTELHTAYIVASRQEENRRRRIANNLVRSSWVFAGIIILQSIIIIALATQTQTIILILALLNLLICSVVVFGNIYLILRQPPPQMTSIPQTTQHSTEDFQITHLFLSYSRKDDKIMRKVNKFFIENGMPTWIDEIGLTPGTPDWKFAIQEAIKSSDGLVAICSSDAVQSKWVREEINTAELRKKPVFIVLARDDEADSLPFGHTTSQYTDIREGQDFKKQMQKLSGAIKKEIIKQRQEVIR